MFFQQQRNIEHDQRNPIFASFHDKFPLGTMDQRVDDLFEFLQSFGITENDFSELDAINRAVFYRGWEEFLNERDCLVAVKIMDDLIGVVNRDPALAKQTGGG